MKYLDRHIIYWLGRILGKRFRRWYLRKTNQFLWSAVEMGEFIVQESTVQGE